MARRRWVPWLLLSTLTVLIVGSGVIAVTGTSTSSVSATQLVHALATPADLGPGWSLEGHPRVQVTKDNWVPSTCWSFATAFGGPAAEATYRTQLVGLPFYQEAIFAPSVDPYDILDMLASCPNPTGPLPAALRGTRVMFLRSVRIANFDGLGDASLASMSRSRMEGAEQTQITAYFVVGDELIRISYAGRAPLSSVRVAALRALRRAAR